MSSVATSRPPGEGLGQGPTLKIKVAAPLGTLERKNEEDGIWLGSVILVGGLQAAARRPGQCRQLDVRGRQTLVLRLVVLLLVLARLLALALCLDF